MSFDHKNSEFVHREIKLAGPERPEIMDLNWGQHNTDTRGIYDLIIIDLNASDYQEDRLGGRFAI